MYAARRSAFSQAGNSAHCASRAGNRRTEVTISPVTSRCTKASRTSLTRVIEVDCLAAWTASDSDKGLPPMIRLLFAQASTRKQATQYQFFNEFSGGKNS